MNLLSAMRRRPRASAGFAFRNLILALLIVTSARASSPDWLKAVLAGEPPARYKDRATIWLLNYGEVHYLPDGKMRETFRRVIRVETEAGEAVAKAAVSYNADTARIIQAHAWVVSADRRKTKSFGKSDFTDQVAQFNDSVWDAQRAIAFTSPDEIEVGGVLAWEVEIESQPGISDCGWFFRGIVPVVKSVFAVTPLPGGRLVSFASSARIAAPVAGNAPGSLLWEMQKIAPVPHEMPAGFIFDPLRISVRCVSADNLIQTWGKFAGLSADIIEPRIVADATVTQQAADLVKGRTDRWERIRAIAEFVQKRITYLSVTLDRDSLAGYRPHFPAEVLQTHLGDCKDKATLMAAMLRAVGENGYLILLSAMNPKAVVPEWPAASFNHAIVAIPSDKTVPSSWPLIDGGALGKLVLFDPTDPGTPLGVLPEQDQGGYGLVVAKQTPDLAALPLETPDENSVVQRMDGKLAADGGLEAKVEETISGSDGARVHYIRTLLGTEKLSLQIEKHLHDTMPLVSNLSWKDEWNEKSSVSHFTFRFSAGRYASMAGPDMMLVCPRLWNDREPLIDWKKNTEGVVSFPAKGIHEEIWLRLPDGFSIDGLPDDWHQELPSVSATVKYRREGSNLVYQCDVVQQAALHNRAEYEALRGLYKKLEEVKKSQVILQRTSVPQIKGSSSATAH